MSSSWIAAAQRASATNRGCVMANLLSLASGLRCRPGDLAIVTYSSCPENIGAIVEILKPACIPEEYGFEWSVVSVGRELRWFSNNGKTGVSRYVDCPDSVLLPISGNRLNESTEESDLRIVEEEVH